MTTLLIAFSAAASLLACVLVLGLRNKVGGGGDVAMEDALRSLKDKVHDSDKAMLDEFARSRKESGNSAKEDREELRKTLAAFEKRLDENAKSQQDLLRQQFEDLLKQLHTQGKQSLDAVKDLRETVEKQLTAIREDNGKRLEEMRKTVDENSKTRWRSASAKASSWSVSGSSKCTKALARCRTLPAGWAI